MAVEWIEGQDDAAIALWIYGRLSAELNAHSGQVAITVPGGSTPFPILQILSAMPLNWPRIAIIPGDDRCVPEGHSASNTGRIRALMEPVGAHIIPLSEEAVLPPFALAWLGMGEDGHIASLFPNTDPQADDALNVRRLTPDPLPPEAPFDRISLTIPALLKSDHLLFVIRGKKKRAIFDAAVAGKHDLPIARLLRNARQDVTCFC